MTNTTTYDVIIIGGSYAGLSAAMTLGRSLRNTLVIDSGKPCNASTPHSHNFLTQDGKTPSEISALAKQQVQRYSTVQFYDDTAVNAGKTENGFNIHTRKGDVFFAKRLVLATGIKDIMPDIAGFQDCWGISAIHCPYCHGYEFHHKRTGVLANGDAAMHYAPLIGNLTDKLMIFTHGEPHFTAEQARQLQQHAIDIITSPLTSLHHDKGYLQHVVLENGQEIALDALYYRPDFVQHCDIPAQLGCTFTEHGYIKVDHLNQTTIAGVFACGDSTSAMRSVANAVAGGNFTGAVINKELAEEAFHSRK